MHKIITKIFASGFNKVLGGAVSLYRNAFVEGGQLIECGPIASEVIDSKLKEGVAG